MTCQGQDSQQFFSGKVVERQTARSLGRAQGFLSRFRLRRDGEALASRPAKLPCNAPPGGGVLASPSCPHRSKDHLARTRFQSQLVAHFGSFRPDATWLSRAIHHRLQASRGEATLVSRASEQRGLYGNLYPICPRLLATMALPNLPRH